MTAQIIDGAALSARIRADLRPRASALAHQGHRPGLAVVLAGDNPASRVYVRNKVKACGETGIHSELYELPGQRPRRRKCWTASGR